MRSFCVHHLGPGLFEKLYAFVREQTASMDPGECAQDDPRVLSNNKERHTNQNHTWGPACLRSPALAEAGGRFGTITLDYHVPDTEKAPEMRIACALKMCPA